MKANAKQICVDDIKLRILTMDLQPGYPLDEIQLAKHYTLSRTPLREVIQRLSGEGYVVVEENRGAKVASLDLAALRHFFQAAPMIYASVARLAAEKATPSDIAALQSIQDTFRAALAKADPAEAAYQNHLFHAQIGDMADSPYLTPSLNRLLIDHTRIAQMFYRTDTSDDEQRIAEAVDQHDAMILAFTERDAPQAVELTLEHWNLSRGLIERFVSPDPLPFETESFANAV